MVPGEPEAAVFFFGTQRFGPLGFFPVRINNRFSDFKDEENGCLKEKESGFQTACSQT